MYFIMYKKAITFLFFVFLYASARGELVQVSHAVSCSNDSAVFECTNYRNPFINWDLLQSEYTSFASVNIVRHHPGTIISDQLGPSPVEYRVITVNSSFMRATVTILNPSSVNGTRVNCNGDSLVLAVFKPNLSFVPLEIKATPSKQDNRSNRFTLTWSQLLRTHLPRLIQVVPSPSTVNVVVENSSTEIVLSTSYYITIFLSNCLEYNSTFMFGRCPILKDNAQFTVDYYRLNTSGAIVVALTCNIYYGNETFVVECGMDGQWSKDTEVICANEYLNTEFETESSALSDTTLLVTQGNMFTDQGVYFLDGVNLSVTVFTLIITGCIFCSCLLAFIIGLTLGLFYKTNHHSRTLISLDQPMHNIPQRDLKGPVYEELALKKTGIDLEQNTAYEYCFKQ